jgi:hypothetical protein
LNNFAAKTSPLNSKLGSITEKITFSWKFIFFHRIINSFLSFSKIFLRRHFRINFVFSSKKALSTMISLWNGALRITNHSTYECFVTIKSKLHLFNQQLYIFILKLQIVGFLNFLLWGLKMFGLTIQKIGQTNSAFLKKKNYIVQYKTHNTQQ